jgi:hypothetical protein
MIKKEGKGSTKKTKNNRDSFDSRRKEFSFK